MTLQSQLDAVASWHVTAPKATDDGTTSERAGTDGPAEWPTDATGAVEVRR